MSHTIVPESWLWARLGDITDIVGGGTPNRDNPSYFQGDIPWVSPTDITKLNDIWIDETAESITKAGLENSSAIRLPVGTVLMTCRASFGLVAINRSEMCTSQSLYSFICDPNLIFNEYLAYYLTTIRDRLAQLAGETTFKGISKSTLAKVEIPLPPLPEQRRIVTILREADEIWKLRRQADEKMQEIIEALFYDMFGDPIENSRGWKTSRIKNLCNLVRGSSPRPQGDPRYFGGPIPRLMVSDITRDGSYVTPRIDSLTEEGAKASRPMSAGSVVMAVSGAPGLPAILTIDACIHDGFVGFRNLSKQLNPEFFLGFLLAIKDRNIAQAVGATFQNLTTDQINNWFVLLPPIELQEQYAVLIADIKEINQQNSNANQQMDTFYQSLLARAFTGELTASWREAYATVSSYEALYQELVAVRRNRTPIKIDATEQREPFSPETSEREELLSMINALQRVLLQKIDEQPALYFTASGIHDDIFTEVNCTLDMVRREMHALSEMGLLKELSLPVEAEPGSVRYIIVYRSLLADDDSQQQDLKDLTDKLGSDYPEEVLI